jgi:hypothetical protein
MTHKDKTPPTNTKPTAPYKQFRDTKSTIKNQQINKQICGPPNQRDVYKHDATHYTIRYFTPHSLYSAFIRKSN